MNHKPSVLARIVTIIVFVSMLAIPLLLELEAEALPERPANNEAARKKSLDLFGFYLEDIAGQSGVDFVHHPPKLDARLDHILPSIASMGASVSVVDFDNDGWNDFYLTTSRQGEQNALYKNMRDGTFKNVAGELGVGDVNKRGTGVSMGSVWADINNDGWEDLFVYKWGKQELFINHEGKSFEHISEKAGFPEWINANAAIWFDYNNDGFVDLFIGGYYKEDINLWRLKNTLIMPESFEYAENGGRNYLLENRGDGTFLDVTFDRGLNSTKWTLAIGAVDLNDDGWQDLFIANDYSVDELYLNLDGKKFEEIGKETRIGYAPKSGMNVSMGDVRNDGRLSIYVSNITEMGILLQGNNFWQPMKNEQKLQYKNIAGPMGVELGGWSWSAQFGDLNNDGYQDLYLANGYISAAKNNSYWYDYSKVTGGNKTIISDALNWPAMEGRSQSGYQHNKVWLNSDGATFADVTDYVSNLPPYDSRAVAMADLWNRGVLDVIVSNQNQPVAILKNIQADDNNWISFKLEGTASNRSAIGAKVTLVWDGKSQTQVVTGGIGYCSQNQRALHFGIGKSTTIDKVIINWPVGEKEQVLPAMEINRLHKIKEEDGTV